MIAVAAVCPPAPLLVPHLADRLASQVPELRAACARAVSALAGVDHVVILSAARPGGAGSVLTLEGATPAAGLARSDRAVVPPVLGDAAGPVPAAVGTAVGARLLADAGIATPVSALQVGRGGGMQLLDSGRTGLLVMADGAACHGEHAPGAPDPRSEGFDRDLVTALRSGDPALLAATCLRVADLAPELRADSLPALAEFAVLATGNGAARAELLHYSAPFGVGYLVALWQWG